MVIVLLVLCAGVIGAGIIFMIRILIGVVGICCVTSVVEMFAMLNLVVLLLVAVLLVVFVLVLCVLALVLLLQY